MHWIKRYTIFVLMISIDTFGSTVISHLRPVLALHCLGKHHHTALAQASQMTFCPYCKERLGLSILRSLETVLFYFSVSALQL